MRDPNIRVRLQAELPIVILTGALIKQPQLKSNEHHAKVYFKMARKKKNL